MENSPLKIIAISSYMSHGSAGLKTMDGILGNALVPVPSTLLSATSNIQGSIKSNVDFEALLESSIKIGIQRGYHIILFCGYFCSPSQIDNTIDMIHRYRGHIKAIVVDPIMGDHGKTYVPMDVCTKLMELVPLANYLLPNKTELEIICKHYNCKPQPEALAKILKGAHIIATSMDQGAKTGIVIAHGNFSHIVTNPLINRKFGGTGDLFDAFFLKYHFMENHSPHKAVKKASAQVYKAIHCTLKGKQSLIMEL
jgi:pyridoxine kinase